MNSNFRVKQSFFRIVVALGAASTISGCSVAKEYHELVHGFWEKVDHLAKADQINEQLRARIVALEKENLQLRLHSAENHEMQRAQNLKSESLHEGGSEGARTEKSLVPEIFSENHEKNHAQEHHGAEAHGGARAPASHEPTAHHESPKSAGHHEDAAAPEVEEGSADLSIMSVPPKKIFAEAMKAFDRREFDRAARGFIALANHKENLIFATAQVNYMAGVSLFELHNYSKSLRYFQKSYELAAKNRQPASASSSNNIVYAPRSLGWMALAHRKLGQKVEAQEKIHELITNFPHSAEAKRFR